MCDLINTRLRLRLIVTVISAVLLACLTSSAAVSSTRDAEIQAKFVSKLALFISWPAGAFASDDAPIRVGILGDDPFDGALAGALANATARGRRFELHSVGSVEEADACHILILGATKKRELRRLARSLEKTSVVSIATSFSFAENGGTIGMEMFKGRVAFEVNNRSAKMVDLKISSRLLQLASTVY
jgi:hypothetical protein